MISSNLLSIGLHLKANKAAIKLKKKSETKSHHFIINAKVLVLKYECSDTFVVVAVMRVCWWVVVGVVFGGGGGLISPCCEQT